jgi:HNH endonuclease
MISMQDDRTGPNPGGLCMCGCGGVAPLAQAARPKAGIQKGQPQRYIQGHCGSRRRGPLYREEDRGYTSECWIWNLATSRGYGIQSRWPEYSRLAYKAIWERLNGPVPRGMELDHLCRVRACVNPDHLEVVTGAENTRRGVKTKLNERKVRQIRLLCDSGRWQRRQIAEAYGVDARTISEIFYRHTWKDVA